MKTYNKFLNESAEYNMWCIGNGIVDDLNINNLIMKETQHKWVYTFILKYSNILSYYKSIKNCYSVVNGANKKRLKQIKKSNILHFSENLNSVINVEIFNGDNIDYLDISDTVGYISYITKDRLNNLNENDDPYNNRFRQEMKIGKFFIKYSIFDLSEIPKQSIDIISNIYKSITKNIINPEKLDIIKGEEIRYWYNEENYENGKGQLNKSCMKESVYQPKFDIYVDNPDVCKLVILKSDNNKLLGRALLWKTDHGLLLDRIYTVHDHDVYTFQGFAMKNKWKLREQIKENERLTIQLRTDIIYSADKSPYLDTFRYYFKEENKLCNYRPYGDYEIFDWY